MKPNQWPYRPEHITNDGETSERIELHKLSGVGIIPNNRLQGFQTYISEMLKNPTTVVEFSPGGDLVRTDSSILAYALHPPCRKFREATNNQFCLECDNFHAKLFCGLTKENLRDGLHRRMNQSSYIKELKRSNKGVFSNIKHLQDRYILEYDCPLLGYRETIFPIFFEQKVIAAFFVGEVTLDVQVEYIKQQQLNFFASHHELGQDVRNLVIFEHESWIGSKENILSTEAYDKLHEDGWRSIREFEGELSDTVNSLRAVYVRTKVDNHINSFQIPLFSVDVTNRLDDGIFSILWDNLSMRLMQIVEDFYFRFILIFWKEQNKKDTLSPLTVVAKGIHPKVEVNLSLESLTYDFSKIKGPKLQEITTCEDERLFDGVMGFPEQLDSKYFKVRYLPLPFYPSGSLVVFVGYHPDNPATSVENVAGGLIDESAKSFYAVVRSALSSLLAARESYRMEMALRIFGHEVSQLTTGVDGLRVTYLSSTQVIRQIHEKKIDDINKDLKGFLRLIYLLSKKADLSVRVYQPKHELKPYRDLLFKWKDIYRLEEEKKCLQIYIPNPPNEYQEVYADLNLIEQLLYNLVNNAVKYCYPGTKIILDCRKINQSGCHYFEISVTNFGIPVDEAIQGYKPYQRGTNARVQEGLGIGLFLASKIAQLHGGNLSHTSEEISSFNVPLMRTFITNRLFDLGKRKAVGAELGRLMKSKIFSMVVALHEDGEIRYSNPSFYALKDQIDQKTFQVSFKVIIPDEKGLK